MYKSANHIPRIDVLRAVAILLVFTGHFAAGLYGIEGPGGMWRDDSRGAAVQILRFTLFDAHRGVVLFFVISGLCIRLSHRAQSTFSTGHFYWRRLWRIYPAYFIALMGFSALQHTGMTDVLAHAFLVHNFTQRFYVTINPPFWSLALECQVYLLYPMLCLMHGRWGRGWTLAVLFALAAVCNLYPVTTPMTVYVPRAFFYLRQFPMVLWLTWYAGFLVADRLVDGVPITRGRRWLLAAAVCMVPVVAYHPAQLGWLDEPVNAVVMSLLVEEFLHWKWQAGNITAWIGKCAALAGAASYSFYLCFEPLIRPMLGAIEMVTGLAKPGWIFALGWPAGFVAMAVISYMAYRVIELPGITLGRNLYGRLRKNAAPQATTATE